jgi:DNA-binding transcriptional ArsR family regulator
MEQVSASSLTDRTDRAHEVSELLGALASGPRLLMMCHLAAAGELAVGTLVERVGISQSALSQHLARLREQGLVAYRREGQVLRYRIADPRVLRVLEVLHELYCPELENDRT